MKRDRDENEHSWERCFDEVSPKLVLYARQLTPSLADAEDVVQMAFVRWWRRYPQADKDHIPLLYAAVRTIALDQRRGEMRRSVREAKSDVAEVHRRPGYFDTTAEQRDLGRIVARSLQGLSEEQREVVTLHLWAGLTFAQVAEAVGASINTVAARYRYALKALQRKLEPLKEELLQPAVEPELPIEAKPDLY